MAEARGRDAARTRERILATARVHFSQYGYDRATVRSIAGDAGVSPNLITRYFTGKRGLFRAATEVDLQVDDALAGPIDELGARMATHVVARWEDGAGNDPLLTMMRAASTDPVAAEHMGSFFWAQAVEPLIERLGGGDAVERASAVSVFIMGTVMQRYVLATGPVAHAEPSSLVAWMADVIQQLLTAPGMGRMPTLSTASDGRGGTP